MLKREVLLTRAKLHGLMYDHIMSERKLRSLKTQLRQVCSVSTLLSNGKPTELQTETVP